MDLVSQVKKDKIVLEKQAEQQKEEKLIGKISPKRGHTYLRLMNPRRKLKKQYLNLKQ